MSSNSSSGFVNIVFASDKGFTIVMINTVIGLGDYAEPVLTVKLTHEY